MADQESKVKTSSQTHTHPEEATLANTSNPENNMKTAEKTMHMWRNRENHTEKGKEAGPQLIRIQAMCPAHKRDKEEWSGE